MSVIELARLGKAMRELQSRYFRTRDNGVLRECKDAERRFDQAVRNVLTGEDRQKTFFSTDAEEGE